jgi:hypothetical protein
MLGTSAIVKGVNVAKKTPKTRSKKWRWHFE